MVIIDDSVNIEEVKKMAEGSFGGMVKGAVDIVKERIALDAELHSDLQAYLLENGSLQDNIWGINIYPYLEREDFIEFDSLINIRPKDNNKSRDIEDENIKLRIIEIVSNKVKR